MHFNLKWTRQVTLFFMSTDVWMQKVFLWHFCGVLLYGYIRKANLWECQHLYPHWRGVSITTSFLLWYLVFLWNYSGNLLKHSCCKMLCPLLLVTAVTCASLSSCGPLSHSQSQRRQRRVDQRSHRFADLLPAVCVDHPAARPAGPGLPAALPPLHTGPAQTGGQLRLSSCTKSSTPKPFISWLFECFCVPTESLPDRHQHPAGWPGLFHVSAEVPAAGLLHADDPSCPVPSGRPHGWGKTLPHGGWEAVKINK